METVHTYTLHKNEPIQKVLNGHMQNSDQQAFNISIVIFENGKEFVIGNAQLPIEDII
jgi:hypothetical protein